MEISRRQFLKVIVVTAGTVEACGDDSGEQPQGKPIEKNPAFFPQSVASGDPRPDSIVLWTRVFDPDDATGDQKLMLEVGLDPFFTVLIARKMNLPASFAHDNNVKVKVTGLRASTHYYYRFVYEKGDKLYGSKIGRTKTAPAATETRAVRFAVATCQDFIGRYYNSWQVATGIPDDQLDFIIFLGDYVYETTGDPRFQSQAGNRNVVFREQDAAIALGTADQPFYAARALSNYRDMYRTVRSDAMLQYMHEMYPFVFVWDDHEYSDDCHGATATYSDGKLDEQNVERRRNAELAFFEFVPMDHPGAEGEVVDFDGLARYPDTRIYRDLVMGQHLRIAVADYRTYRPDHLVPEDAFPGTVVMDSAALVAAGVDAVFSTDTFAYIDIDDPAFVGTKAVLRLAYTQLATEAGLDSAAIAARLPLALRGNLSLAYVNAVLARAGGTPIDPAGKPRGLAWVHMGKRDIFSQQGSRYVVIKDTLDVYSAYQHATTQGASENVFGTAQQTWLEETLAGPETWKLLVSSVSLTSLMVDLRDKTDVEDATLRNRYYLNCDMWDGFPTQRKRLLDRLAQVPGGKALVVSGDIHASFASVEQGVACLTAPAISSQSIKGGSAAVVTGAGFDPSSAVYKYTVTQIDQTFREANSGIVFTDCDNHGFLVVEVTAEQATATFYLIPGTFAENDYARRGSELQSKLVQKKFRVTPGSITPI